jgi:glycosyltransferase involved in cell wall biosynthesis
VHRPPAHTPRMVAANRLRYGRLVDLVGHHAAAGDTERVLRSATLAAAYAWSAPNGLLSDPVLERLVVSAVRPEGRPIVDGTRSTGRVLHVLSEAYAVGGHTRLTWRWISRDPRRADVALTNHAGPVPEQLSATVTAAGGRVHDLRSDQRTLTGRATALRALMDRADLVVLHVHPYDAVTLAAVQLPGVRPPVILENHADHAFWLGVGAADVVSNFRSFGERLCRELRGVPLERSAVVPLPIDAVPATAPRDEIRRALGLAPDAVVAVCVAAENKMSPLWGRGMDHLLDRALTWCSQLTILLVGAPPTGAWARLAARYPGRLRPVGSVPDAAPYYTAADLYLESYPTRAGTSVLEAAMLGLPVLTLTDLPPEDLLYVYQADSPGLVAQPRAETPEKYVRMLRSLVADPELRARRGAEVRAAVSAAHCGEGWASAMEALYERARGSSAVDVDSLGEGSEDPRYGAMLQAFVARTSTESLEPVAALGPLDHLDDDRLRADAFAVSNRDRGPSLTVRLAPGWENQTSWTSRLLALASDRPRLSVSLPFVADDDVAGSRSAAVLTDLLAGLGQTPEGCGDINVESWPPRDAVPSVTGELPLTTEALDWLEQLLGSPGWGAGQEPAPTGAVLAAP